jgi:ABC-type branched-subunit amino acid transport system permease subunit
MGAYRLAFNGLILVLVVIYLPNGIITVKRKD